jgi:hypothetical protein
MRVLKTGDLLIRRADSRPVLVVAVVLNDRPKYGSKTEKRRLYKLLDGTERSLWIIDTEITVKYKLPRS